MHFYPKHQSDETDSKDGNKKGRMRRNKMEKGKKLKLHPTMIMWVLNVVYLYTEEVFEKYKLATKLSSAS